jgi:predicted ATPase/transcriptional regulator with XRE-family HTH domain
MSNADGGRSPFGALLRRLRLQAGISQEQLAERARVSADGVGALERGTRRAPYRETVDLLAAALGASPSETEDLHAAARRPRRVTGGEGASAPSRIHGDLAFEASPLRGRERALADLGALIGHRLVTIVGSGGIGKTRVAVALCNEPAVRAQGDVWFVALEALASANLVASSAARVIGAALSADVAPEAAVAHALRGRSGIVVLDNCEHVAAGVRTLVDALLAQCPGIHVLATSRRPLSVRGEAVYRLASLDVPPPEAALSAAEALDYGAVALFVDRANAADATFHLGDEQVQLVAGICRRLDGIALAIELAAARTVALSVSSLAERLDERFRLLTAGSHTAMARQRTLSALIDWSYDLLAPAERALLDRAAVFAGGFDLPALLAVCGDAAADEYEVLDLLTSLIDQSLVIADTAALQERYRLLESTRAYATDRLDARGERQAIAHRHAEHFAAKARDADATWGTIKADRWVASVEPDTNNFRLAMEWALGASGDLALGATIAGWLQRFWSNGGLEREGGARIEQFLQRIDEAAHRTVAARLWSARAWLELGQRKYETAARAVRLYEDGGDDLGLADALRQRAIGALQMGRFDEAAGDNARALAIFRTSGDLRSIAGCLDVAAMLARGRREIAQARSASEEALTLFRTIGSDGGVASALRGLAELASLQGDMRTAIALFLEARAISQRGKYTSNIAHDAMLLSACYTMANELSTARAELDAALAGAQSAGNVSLLCTSLSYGAALIAREGDIPRAAALMAYARKRRSELGLGDDESEKALFALHDALVRAGLDDAARVVYEAEGLAWTEEHAVAQALLAAPSAAEALN